MSKLNQLVSVGKEVEIGGIHLDIKPLTVSSLPLLMKLGQNPNSEEQAEAMMEILKRTLKDSVPDATEEEIKKIPIEHTQKIMEAILEVNQLQGSADEQQLVDKLKRMKNERIGQAGDKKAN